MYYLSTDKVVIQSNYPKFIITQDETKAAIANVDLIKNIITLNIHASSKYSDFSTYFQYKDSSYASAIIDLKAGTYDLLTSISINGFTLARSVETLDKTFNQFILDPELGKTNSIVLNKESINIVLNNGIDLTTYTKFINDSNLFYILETDTPIITTTYGIILNKSREIKVRSSAVKIINNEPILIEEADYISALILQLKEAYPEVQFYNNDQDVNDTKYNEFVKYQSYLGSFTTDIITTVLFSDPIYGNVIRTTCDVDFEYHTSDIAKYNKRRFDFHINRFLSNHTTSVLSFPLTDKKLRFTVHWDRQSLQKKDTEYKKQTELNKDKKTQYIFKTTATLIVTIYRSASTYSVIRQVLLKESSNPNESFIYTDTTKKWIQLTENT